MERDSNKFLTFHQFIMLIVGFIIGTEFISLPNILANLSKQDAWISVLIGTFYPLCIILLSSYIAKKFPNQNILDINKKHFGKKFGTILNLIFLIQFAIYPAEIVSDFVKMLYTNILPFLTPTKISMICIIVSYYAASRGLEALAKANEFIPYFLFLIIAVSLFAIKDGTIYNIQPVFGSGSTNIIKASFAAIRAYSGIEIIPLIHPFLNEPKKAKKYSLLALLIVSFIYVWTVFITTFYLGPDIVPKTYWSFLFVFSSINIPIVNSFRSIFLIIWTVVGLKIVSNYIYAASFILNKITKFDFKKLCLIVSVFSFILFTRLSDTALRDYLNTTIIYISISLNCAVIGMAALTAYIKGK